MSYPGGLFPGAPETGLTMPGTGTFAPFSGFASTPSSSDKLALPGTLTGTQSMDHKGSGMLGFESQSIPITMPYVSSHTSITALKQDVGVNMLVWAANPKWLRHMKSNLVREHKGPEPTYDRVAEPVKFKCFSRLQRYMQSFEGRQLFGSKTDFAAHVLPVWRFAGVNKTAIADNFSDVDEAVLTIIVAKRARIRDPTCIFKFPAPPMSALWVVWLRIPYESSTTGFPAKSAKIPTDKAAIDAYELALFADADKMLVDPLVLSTQVGRGPIPSVSGPTTHMWKGCWWYGPRGSAPPEYLYNTLGSRGHAEHIGLTTDRYGDSANFRNKPLAETGFWPITDAQDWVEDLAKLPDLEILIGVK